jgi:hypothetical protein
MSAVTRTIVAAALAAFFLTNPADAASLAATSPCARRFDVPITIYNRSYMTASELDAIVETAGSLWHPYGVTLAPVSEHGVAVIVSHGSTEPEGSSNRLVLGTTMFSDGHAVPYIHLWVDAAEELVYATTLTHAWNMPTIERDSQLVPVLGVALAHELGHFLLDTSSHTLDGMLQRVIPLRDLQHPSPARLGLSTDQRIALCTPKENHMPSLSK